VRRKLILGGLIAASYVLLPAAASGGGTSQALPCGSAVVSTACGGVQFVYDNACDAPVAVVSNPAVPWFQVTPTVKCPSIGAIAVPG
jgi:hypothetical protein